MPPGLVTASPTQENIASVARFRRYLAEVFRGLWFRRRLRVGLPDTSVRVRLLFADEVPRNPAEGRKYLLWRLAGALDINPEHSRLAYMVLPSPLSGPRHAVLCAVTGENVVQQFERVLAESRVRYSGIAPNSILLFNLFHGRLTGPPGAPVLLLAAGEDTVTTILTLEGCPVFWRTRGLGGPQEGGKAAGRERCGELLRDVTEAIAYGEDRLGLNPPGHILVAGILAGKPGLADWLAIRARIPTYLLDTRRLLKRVPCRLAAEGWNRWGAALGAAAHQ